MPNRVCICIDDIDERALIAVLDRRHRYENDVLLCIDEQLDVHELVGEKRVVGIRKAGPEPQRTGRRIDLIVSRQQLSRGQLLSKSPPLVGLRQERLTGVELLHDLGNIVFRNGEDHRDGLDLRDDQQPVLDVDCT